MIRRFFQVLPAGLDALLAGMLTTFLVVLPVLVGWLGQLSNGVSWIGYWRFAASAWLVSNGVPYELSAASIHAIPEFAVFGTDSFIFGLMPLLLTLLVVRQAWSAGRRLRGLDLVWPSVVVGVIVYVAYAVVVSSATGWLGSRPQLPWLVIAPAVTYGVPMIVASLRENPETHERSRELAWMRSKVAAASLRGRSVATVVADAWNLCVPWMLGLVLVAAAGSVVALVVSWFPVSNVYEALHVDVWGAVALTLGQLVYVPNFVVAVGTWIYGGTVALGGSAVSVFSSAHGPIAAIPVFATIPADTAGWHVCVLVVPCLVLGVVTSLWMRQHPLVEDDGRSRDIAVVAAAALMAGIVGMLVGWIAEGIVGQAVFGPVPWTLGLAVGVQALVGGLAGSVFNRYFLASPTFAPSSADPSSSDPATRVG